MISFQAAWFSRARDRRGATGYLEERLKNYRKRQRARSGKPSIPQIPVDSTFDVTVESMVMLPGMSNRIQILNFLEVPFSNLWKINDYPTEKFTWVV